MALQVRILKYSKIYEHLSHVNIETVNVLIIQHG